MRDVNVGERERDVQWEWKTWREKKRECGEREETTERGREKHMNGFNVWKTGH